MKFLRPNPYVELTHEEIAAMQIVSGVLHDTHREMDPDDKLDDYDINDVKELAACLKRAAETGRLALNE